MDEEHDEEHIARANEVFEKYWNSFPHRATLEPTDGDLIRYYLIRKISERSFLDNLTRDVDFFQLRPEKLMNFGPPQYNNTYLYFYSVVDREYLEGNRLEMARVMMGYWRPTGDATRIEILGNDQVGIKQDFYFYVKFGENHWWKPPFVLHLFTLERIEEIENNKPW